MEIFRRTLAARVAPILVAVVLLVLLAADAVGGRLTLSWWPALMGVLALVSALAAVMALGDEVRVEEGGLRTCNRFLRRERFVAWEDIREVRPVHGRGSERLRVLFVIPRQGPRLILDSLTSLERLEELIASARERVAGARL